MKDLTTNMKNLLAGKVVPALATFWKIKRADGVLLGFTDWSEAVIASDVKYHARTGMSRSAIQARADLSPPGFQATAMVASALITDDDIRAGKYDGATIANFMAVPTDTVDFPTYGIIQLPGYRIGEITLTDGIYTAEIRGIGYALQQAFVELFMPVCTAEFGDARCKKDLAPITDTGVVTSVVTPNRLFAASLSTLNAGGKYMFGLIEFTGGANIGTSMEIRNWTGGGGASGNFLLYFSVPRPIAIGDSFKAIPGCDKTYNQTAGQGCYQWSNTDNFRGFPFVPGMNFLFDYGVALQ